MRRKLLSVVTVFLLAATLSGLAGAQSGVQTLPGGGWTTGTQVQNVGTAPATITMTVYGVASGSWDKSYTTVPPGSSVNFLANQFGWTDGSIGSAVVESNEPIVAQTNITNGTAAAQYQGVGTTATTITFPLVKNNYKGAGKYTTFFVQNAGAEPATIYATYADESGTTYDWNSGVAVEAYRMVVLEPSSVNFPTGKLGSLKVWSAQPLAGVVNEHHVSDTIILQATRGFTASDAASTLLIPTIKRQFGNRSTGPIIQNVSAGAINITITYKGTGIDFVQHADNVPAGASVVFYENSEVCPATATCWRTGTPLPVGTLASAVVTGTDNMVGVANESYYTVPAGERQRQTATAAFGLSLSTTKLAAPLYKVNHDYKNSGLRVQNTDLSNAATAHVTFALGGSGGTPVTEYKLDCSIGGGQSVTLFMLYLGIPAECAWNGTPIPAGWSSSSTSPERFGSVMVTADRAIVGVVTESDWDPILNDRQDIKSYEAFNLP